MRHRLPQCLWLPPPPNAPPATLQGRTLLFQQSKRLIAVTVGQSADPDQTAPLLPPSFAVWLTVTTDLLLGQPLFLQWGVTSGDGIWRIPTGTELPPGSVCLNGAVRTPLTAASSRLSVTLNLGPPASCPTALEFVLFQPPDSWTKTCANTNFMVPLRTVIAELQLATIREGLMAGLSRHDLVGLNCSAAPEIHHVFVLPAHEAELDVGIWCSDEGVAIDIMTNLREPVVLHWGFLSTSIESGVPSDVWRPPDPRLRPSDCLETPPGSNFVESPFLYGLLGPATSLIQSVQLVFPYDVIFEHCVSAEKLRNTTDTEPSWVLPILRRVCTAGAAFPERLVFVLRTRSEPSVWIHNECVSDLDNWRVELCPLNANQEEVSTTDQSTELVKHAASMTSNPNQDFQITIPFSEGFKAKLFEALQRATEEREVMDRLQRADFASELVLNSSLHWSSKRTGEASPLLVNPKFSVDAAELVRWADVTTVTVPAKPFVSETPPQSGGILGFLTPPPVPGTVLYFNTVTLDDPGGTAHVLAVEEPNPASAEYVGLCNRSKVVIKVHLMVSINVPCIVHWGWLTERSGEWIQPASDVWPDGTEPFDAVSVDSPMRIDPRSRMCRLEIKLPNDQIPQNCAGLVFVLRDVTSDRWIKSRSGEDLAVKFRRDRIPNFLFARSWRGAHSHLVVRLLQNELTVDASAVSSQRYVTLTNLVESVCYDRIDVVEFWAWLFVWWRFSHLGCFDWQRHAHARPWECSQLSLQVSEAIVAQWKGTTRSRPIIRLLLQHINCLRPDRDLREELNSILTRSGLILLPFFEQWYRKVHNCLGVEDWVICRGVIAMLETLNVSSFYSTLQFYGYDFESDISIQAPPIIPPSFNFLQSQLTHIAQLRMRDGEGLVSAGDTPVETLSLLNPRHPSTSFIARHIETQSVKLRSLVDKLRSFGDAVASLFFGVHIDVAEASASKESSLPAELINILVEIRETKTRLRPPCPRIIKVSIPGGGGDEADIPQQSLEEMLDEANEYYRLFELASRGRIATLPVISHCTDHRVIRDFVFLDIALDNVQQMTLSRVFGFTGPPLHLMAQKTLPRKSNTHCCEDLSHPSWNSPQTLLVPRLRYDAVLKRWTPSVKCQRFQCGVTIKLIHIIANLVTGLKMLHPSVEEANSLLNDWRVITSQHLATSFTSFADYAASFEQQAIVEALQNPLARADFMNFISSFIARVERCTSRIIDLCLVYFSDKVKFIHGCLSDLDLLKKSWDRLESASFPPCPPRPFRGTDPLLTIHSSEPSLGAPYDDAAVLGKSEQSLLDVHSFVLGIVKHSVLFWIVLALTRITPTLRSFTHVQNWRLLSPVRFAVGSILCIDSFDDLRRNEPGSFLSTFLKPVLLIVKHAIGHERIPFNTAALILGPTVVPLKGEESVLCAPHLLSPLSLQARQMSLMAAVPLDPAIFDQFSAQLRALKVQQGDLVELFMSEDQSHIEIRPMMEDEHLLGEEEEEEEEEEGSGLRTPEADAALGAEVWRRLREPVIVSPLLPPQTGPLLPSLRHFCSHPLPLERSLLPLEESRSSTRTHESCKGDIHEGHRTIDTWGAWRRNNPLLRSIPVITPGLFDRLFAANSRWFLTPEEFTPLLVGCRAMALRRLREVIKAEEEVRATTTPTLAVPFGAFEATLRDPENHALSEKLYALLCDLHRLSMYLKQHRSTAPAWRAAGLSKDESSASLGSAMGQSAASSKSGSDFTGFLTDVDSGREMRKVERLLRECRSVVRSLKPTRDFTQSLRGLIECTDNWDKQSIGRSLAHSPDRLWSSIKNVWCSQFTPAVWHTTQVLSAPFDSPRFSVLIQHMPVSHYAFKVELHDKGDFCYHDKTDLLRSVNEEGAKPKIFGEVFAGLPLSTGELFSGGHVMLGRPLAFVRSNNASDLRVLCFSSQPHALRLRKPSLILRPDGNIRGLGKIMPSGGLVCACTDATSRQRFEFHREPLFSDGAWRTYLLNRLADAAVQAIGGDVLAVEGIISPLSGIPSCRAILLAGSASTPGAKSPGGFSLQFIGALLASKADDPS